MKYETMDMLLSICREIGTPIYAYDMSNIRDQIDLLKCSLPEKIKIFYSVKANPNLGIVSFIRSYIDGFEVSSEGELFIALKAGVSPERIIFSGPGKTIVEIEYAIEESIGCIVAESERELKIINDIASHKGKSVNVALRINPIFESIGARIKMGGASKQFGIDEELVQSILNKLNEYNHIDVVGIQVYMGTQILDENRIVENSRKILEVAKKIADLNKFAMKFIDFGGGFGIPYFKGEKYLDMHILSKGFQQLFDEYKSFFISNHTKIAVESGRYIMAESGYFMTRVLYKKKSRGKTFLIVDGGSNFHSAAAGIGRFVRNNFPVDVLKVEDYRNTEFVDIVGPLCTSTDILAQNVEIPICKEGDIIVFPKSGAYGLSASMTGFLSHPRPAEVLFNEKSYHIVGEKGNRDDFTRGQKQL